MKHLFWVWIFAFLSVACSSGGSGGGGGNSGGSQSGNYSISLDRSTMNFQMSYGGASSPQLVRVTFKGDGVIVGYPPGVIDEGLLLVEQVDQSNTSVTFQVSVNPAAAFIDTTPKQQVLRFLSGKANGDAIVHKDLTVSVQKLDGFDVTYLSSNRFYANWGEAGSLQLAVGTFAKAWTTSSSIPDVVLSPASGSGATTVTASFAGTALPVGTTLAVLTFTASSGEQIERTFEIELAAPELRATQETILLQSTEKGELPNPVELDLSFTSDVAVQWHATVEPWMSISSDAGVLGSDVLSLGVDPESVGLQPQTFSGQLIVDYDVPGASYRKTFDVTFHNEPFYLQASPGALAFSDGPTDDSYMGEFRVNEDVTFSQIQPSVDWVVIDAVENQTVRFHLLTSALSDGFHQASIGISAAAGAKQLPTSVNLGYYKADTTTIWGRHGEWATDAFAIPDKLGPWIYVARGSNESGSIIYKYNYQTRSIDGTIDVAQAAYIGAMVISDDGQTLYVLSNALADNTQQVLATVPVADFDTYTFLDIHTRQWPEYVGFARINGLEMISDGISWFNADTAELIQYNSGSNRFAYSQSGEFRLAAGGTAIEVSKLQYVYNSESFVEVPLASFDNDAGLESPKLAANDLWLTLVSGIGVSENQVGLYQLTVNGNTVTDISERTNISLGSLADPPSTITASNGNFAVMTKRYNPDTGFVQQVATYDKTGAPLEDFTHDGDIFFGLRWFFTTADEKAVSYMVKDNVSSTSSFYMRPFK